MAIPPWTVELLRRGLSDVARRASEPETLEKLKTQATEIINELPQTAARGFDAVMRATEAGRKNVQRWSQRQSAVTIPLVNASGVLVSPYGTGVRVSDQAVEAAYACLHGDIRKDHQAMERLQRHLHRQLPSTSDVDIAVTTNFQATLVALVIGMSQKDILVHRSQAIRLRGGTSLVDTMNALVPIVQEVGANDGVEMSDFDEYDSFCLVLADDETHDALPKPLELNDRDCIQVVVLPIASLKQSANDTLPSVEKMLDAGADLVIVEGGGVFGGPECGIMIGKTNLVRSITSTAIWPSFAAGSAVMAMLASTMQNLTSALGASLPIEELIETSDDNLRLRAERMATRLSASDSIKSCQVTNDEARVTTKGRWRFPSRQVRIEHASLDGQEWADQLRDEFPSLLVGVEGSAIKIDLRWIAPANDARIGELLVPQHDVDATENPETTSTP
ncbi:L-seryl-tRNA(Sec) selenium transferase [Planctomycetes bacterium CA13]|uniref:L-seryl-tRNA(Sec) selenium transferase n=1 Tax=Novipirellula herctigrandis TaxID=2527986 RepID=A0A5C5YP07_9BACT|nr:L-seryl-tRNA(Sec) selenium transferase [Planctomycetes bacterium CA13]